MRNCTPNELLEKLAHNHLDQLTEEEKAELLLILEQNSSSVLEEWLESKWKKTAFSATPSSVDYERMLDQIKVEGNIPSSSEKKSRLIRLASTAQRVAAVLFIPVMVLCGYLFMEKRQPGNAVLAERQLLVLDSAHVKNVADQQYVSPAGTRSKIMLADSTTVWLNSDSKLLVASSYGSSNRRVRLSGQGYFDVKKNAKLPFEVEINRNTSIKVTGTTFTIGAYEDSKTIETVLINGTVFVNHGKEVVKMVPSQKVVVSKSSDLLSVSNVSDESYKSWKDGVLIFRETPMLEVLSTLEKWFNVRFHVKHSEIMGYSFTAKLDNCSLSQVLEYMSYSSPMSYSVKERDVYLTLKKMRNPK